MLLAFDDNHSLLQIQRGDLSPLLQSTRDFLAMVSKTEPASSAPSAVQPVVAVPVVPERKR